MHPPCQNEAVLDLDPATRARLWRWLGDTVEEYTTDVETLPVAPPLDAAALRTELAALDPAHPLDAEAAAAWAAAMLRRHQVHTPHPRYFGLFNPAPAAMGIVADALVAAFNPQMAAWSHSPFAAEAERTVVQQLGARFGYDPATCDGVFTSGGSEANHTALLCALTAAFPDFARTGARGLEAAPTVYMSRLAHGSMPRAVRLCGLGSTAVRAIEVDRGLRLDAQALERRIGLDRAAGSRPLMLISTAGSTSAGVLDEIETLGAIARREGLWHHVDAAWGGAAALVPELRPWLAGIEQADSITFDAHKFLSAPMGAGMVLTRHADVLSRTFGVAADYMPRDAAGMEVTDPFHHSIQWSRRFIGLKVLLALAVAGWDGYAAVIRHQTAMGARLRIGLEAAGWEIVNETPLPVVCFRRPGTDSHATAQRVVAGGRAWISSVELPGGAALRACITNFRTQARHVDELVAVVEAAARE